MNEKEHYIDEDELNGLVQMIAEPDPDVVAASLRAWIEALRADGVTHVRRQLHSLRDDFDEKKAVIDALGVPLLQSKRAFAWNEPRPPIEVPDRLEFRSFAEVGYDLFADTVARAHQGTLDRSTQQAMEEIGDDPERVAEWMRSEYDDAGEYFDYEPEWWQLAFDKNGVVVGYVQPVLFPGEEDESREATLYYIGVVPEARGNGYVDDLLAKGIEILQTQNIWRIYSDTDTENRPMIRAFERAGFEEDGIYYIWQGELVELLD